MFKRSFGRVDKAARHKKPASSRKLSWLQRSLAEQDLAASPSPIVTLAVGRDARVFAAHRDVLCQSPFFGAACRDGPGDAQTQPISLPDEDPEVLSAVLEYLYKGDYYPRLLRSRHRDSWELEDGPQTPHASPGIESRGGRAQTVVYLSSIDEAVLRDTVIYCAAHR